MWGFYRGSCVGNQGERPPSWPSLCSCKHCVQFHRAAWDRKIETQRLTIKGGQFNFPQRVQKQPTWGLSPIKSEIRDSSTTLPQLPVLAASTAKELKAAQLRNTDRTSSFSCQRPPCKRTGTATDPLYLSKRKETESHFWATMGETTWRLMQLPGIFSTLVDPHICVQIRSQDPPQTLLQAPQHSTLMQNI